MKKQVAFQIRGHRADIGDFKILRLLPNQHTYHVGHFVFLDYIPPFALKEKRLDPNAAHPHRGIATLTYSLSGEFEHFDSRGHKGTVRSGGVQWMKAGNGIIHNESPGPDTKVGLLGHGFQFWINLPSRQKHEEPGYMAVQAEDLPVVQLADGAGWVKVLVGEYGGQSSPIPTYAQQYLYHIRLLPGQRMSFPTEAGLDYAIFLPQHDLEINGTGYHSGDMIGFDDQGGELEIANPLEAEADFLLFGGAKYTEPFVAYGPFVMNTQEEIRQAYSDFHKGKYGEMVYR